MCSTFRGFLEAGITPPIVPVNEFTFATGTAPSLAAFATTLGITLTNPTLVGDTIKFDNSGYTIPNLFVNAGGYTSDLLSVKHRASIVDDFAFQACGILSSYTEYECIDLNFKAFESCSVLTNIVLYNTINIGLTTGQDATFAGITGLTINVTAKVIHQTSNAGGLEGDLADLAANNTVNFTWI